MSENKIFISFSSKDLPYVREIMSGLASQEINFWDYSNEIQEIEAGEAITERLKKEIDECDYFIAVISLNSTDSQIGKFTRFELEYAVERNCPEENKIIPVVIRTKEGDIPEYKGIYKSLKNIKYEEFELKNVKSYVKMLKGICNQSGHIYIPRIEAHHRLPFWKFFRDEVVELAHSNAELMSILGEFNEYFKKGNIEKAYFLISFFIDYFKYKLQDKEIFYPYIVKAVCEQHLGKLNDAEQSYRQAEKNRPENVNVYGGLADIYMQKKDYDKAEEYFGQAMDLAPLNQDRDEKINYIICLIESGKRIPKHFKRFFLNLDDSLFSEEELIKIKNAKLALLYRFQDFSGAIDIITGMIDEKSYNTATIVCYHNCLLQTGGNGRAAKILLQAIEDNDERFDKHTGYYFLSDYYLMIGEPQKALDIYEKYLLLPEKRTRQLYVKYARIFKHLNNKSKLESVCEEILSGKLFSLSETREDYYYDGFAQYLLGNIERAKYDFERSDNFDLYYSEYEAVYE